MTHHFKILRSFPGFPSTETLDPGNKGRSKVGFVPGGTQGVLPAALQWGEGMRRVSPRGSKVLTLDPVSPLPLGCWEGSWPPSPVLLRVLLLTWRVL